MTNWWWAYLAYALVTLAIALFCTFDRTMSDESRKWWARVALAAPVWPLILLALVGVGVARVVRIARGAS